MRDAQTGQIDVNPAQEIPLLWFEATLGLKQQDVD